jgi:hypothetical protein
VLDVAKQLSKGKQIRVFCSQAVKLDGTESERSIIARIRNNLDNILEVAIENGRLANQRSTRQQHPIPATTTIMAPPVASEQPKPERTIPPHPQNIQKKEMVSAPPLCNTDRVSSTPTQLTLPASRCPSPQLKKAKTTKKMEKKKLEEKKKMEKKKKEKGGAEKRVKPTSAKMKAAHCRVVSRESDIKTLPTSRHPAASDARRQKKEEEEEKEKRRKLKGRDPEKQKEKENEIARRKVGAKFRPAEKPELNERERELRENANNVEAGPAVVQQCAVAPSRPERPLRGRPCDSCPPTSADEVLPAAPAPAVEQQSPLFVIPQFRRSSSKPVADILVDT